MNKYTSAFIAAIGFLSVVSSFPTGAPIQACEDMIPGHGVLPQSSVMPYSVHSTVSSVSHGDHITLTVSGDKPFKGLLLQGRQDDKIVGSFKVADDDNQIQTLDCPSGEKNAVTQKDREDKNSINVEYIVPDVKGKITFYITVVQSKEVFWAKQPTISIDVN